MERIIEPHGLLADFLQEKVRLYVAPTRAGTPRGQSIGFSKEKYLATLFTMTSFNVKRLAKKLRISYGVLRKWRTEPDFKKTVTNHYKEFADLFFKHVRTRIMAERRDTNDILKLPESSIAKTQLVGVRGFDEFNDGELYGDLLILKLWNDLIAEVRRKKSKNIQDILFYNEILWIFDWIGKRKGNPTLYMDWHQKSKGSVFKGAIKEAIRILVLSNPTVNQRKTAIFSLTCIAQALEREEEHLRVTRGK